MSLSDSGNRPAPWTPGQNTDQRLIQEMVMNDFVTLGFVVLMIALVVALDGSLALMAIDRLAQSEGYTDIQSAMTLTDVNGVR